MSKSNNILQERSCVMIFSTGQATIQISNYPSTITKEKKVRPLGQPDVYLSQVLKTMLQSSVVVLCCMRLERLLCRECCVGQHHFFRSCTLCPACKRTHCSNCTAVLYYLRCGNSQSHRAMTACWAAAFAVPALMPLPVQEAETEAVFA